MKIAAALTFLSLAVSVSAAQSPRNELAFTTHGAFFAVSVADLGASTLWYAEKFGLTTTRQIPKQVGNVGVVILEGGGLIVELLQMDDAAAPARAANLVHGIFKAGMIVDDLTATLTKLRARGVEIAYGPYPASASQRANVIIKDNAGNLIQLFQ